MSQPTRKLPALVYRLGWISLFADVSSEMIYPLLPLFLTGVLKAPVLALGLTEGVAEAVVSLMKGWSGLHSDRTGKRAPYITMGYGLTALAKPWLALSPAWGWVLAGRSLDRAGKGLRGPARDALMSDAVESEEIGRAAGFRQAMDTAGAFLGSAVCYLFLLSGTVGIRSILWIAAIPGLIAAALTLGLPKSAPKVKPVSHASWKEFSKTYWIAVALTSLFALANSSDTLPLLLASKVGYGVAPVIALYILFNFVFTLASSPAGKWADKFGTEKVMLVGWGTYALVYLGFGLATYSNMPWLMGVYGISKALTEVGGLVLVLKVVPPDRKGQGVGMAMMIKGIAVVLGNGLAGLAWDRVGMSSAFWLGAGFAIVGVLCLAVLQLSRPKVA